MFNSFYRARYYDSKVSRFLTRDPIGFKGGTNLYIYTGNNPVKFKDPNGLASYSGEVELTSAGRFIVGGAYLSGKMHTECINGKRFVGDVRAVFAGAAVGIPFADTKFDLIVSDSTSGYGNLNNLSGLASTTSLSVAAGPWGGSVSQTVLGQAQTTFPLGTQVGIDLSATAMGGWSFVSNVHEESCCQ